MAKSPDTALPFLTKLASRLRPLAVRDLGDLQTLKEAEEGNTDIKHWDTAYYMRKHLEQVCSGCATVGWAPRGHVLCAALPAVAHAG